jgi:tRNA U54 and U55 pseudouridine synthase Pus10
MNVLEKAQKILQQPVCDHCLGRQFGQLLSGYTNAERGELIRALVAMGIDKSKGESKDISNGDDKAESLANTYDFSNFTGFKFHNLEFGKDIKRKKCSVCKDFFLKLDSYLGKIKKVSRKYNFRTFLVGTKLPFEMINAEESLWERVGIDYCEPMKAEINREMGKLIEKNLHLRFDGKRPDVNIIVNVASNKIQIGVNPLFIYGEYQKLKRGIPQTKWPSGKYKTSVEQIIAKPFMAATKAKNHKLHGCIAGDTEILLYECSCKISNLEKTWKDHKIITFNEQEKTIETSKIEDFMKIELNVFKLKTKETGREIVVSKEHPFYTPNGMTALANLKVGDLLAVNPVESLEYSEPTETITVNEDKILEVIEKYIPTSYKLKIINELKERNLLPLKTISKDIFIFARVLAFLFGDGTVRYDGKRDVGLEFYGPEEDLKEIQNDLKKIGFGSAISKRKGGVTTHTDYYGNEKIIEGKGIFRLVCYSKSLWTLLVVLGAPIGNKVTNSFEIPEWIKNSDKGIKKEFLASLFGCEMDTPRLDKRKYNRKSFNTPRFSMNKIEAKLDSMITFMNDLKGILSEFSVNTLKIRLVPYTTRKDGNKSIKVILDFNNNFENLINLYNKINFRYCKKKENYSKCVLEYLLTKKYIIDKRKELFNKSMKLHKKDLTLSQIHRNLGSENVSKKDVWLWIHGKIKPQNIKVPNDFPDFDVWMEKATKDLNSGLVWESVESIEKFGKKSVYDLTVPENHNFFANGFLVSNCGREDIDARCLGWRPFVLELLEPQRRNIEIKSLAGKIAPVVRVRKLHFSDIAEVRRIKEARCDKTYSLIVECEKKITRADIKKLSSIALVNQKTPERVLHRRADKYRKRKVRSLKVKMLGPKKFRLMVTCEAGLYIKELVTGDSGRTKPSISEILGVKCTPRDLDVTKIHVK